MKQILTLSIILSSCTYALERNTQKLGHRNFGFRSAFQFDNSISRFDVDGVQDDFVDNESFSKMDLELALRYGIGENFELDSVLKVRSVASTHIVSSQDFNNSKIGIESFQLAAKFAKSVSTKFSYAFWGLAGMTLYSNTDYGSTATPDPEQIVLGDAGTFYGVGASLNYFLNNNWSLFSSLDFFQPANKVSAEIPWALAISRTSNSKAWKATLGVEGIVSLGLDDFENDPQNKIRQDTGATYSFNSINRTKLEPYVGLDFDINPKWRLGLRGSQVMSGSSIDQTRTFGVSLSWRSLGKSKESKKIGKFKEYDVDAYVTKVSSSGKFIILDKGRADDLSKGGQVDIYQVDYEGNNVLVASGNILKLKNQSSIVKIRKYYKKIKIKKNFIGRASLR